MMWTKEEHAKFLEALNKYNINTKREEDGDGKMFVGLGPHVANLIAMDIGTRTVAQVRSHAQKYFQNISKKKKQASWDNSIHFVPLGKRKSSIFDDRDKS
ncbi:hypothetical protein GUITHDRAFT_120719 [Guillardia theta CCMP2712]|uniref:Uncharacterized protein n=1 Tax=Guillardia theta (strain CCMP2712) TaxID=905079 RepID=L1IA47_GUITC|nr:hypothetical protein GUITHDRAFT_120719 [Guillardia theta CCMP2712]EKX33103.1 hypothetical protein GUITHDRAFT_120719 [Guillardia theta CCMP2712]|eukprot:XP_005820083.1 hypothetical protein GUITHDRAFT_120719 [Guillardia theta CCMP2712]